MGFERPRGLGRARPAVLELAELRGLLAAGAGARAHCGANLLTLATPASPPLLEACDCGGGERPCDGAGPHLYGSAARPAHLDLEALLQRTRGLHLLPPLRAARPHQPHISRAAPAGVRTAMALASAALAACTASSERAIASESCARLSTRGEPVGRAHLERAQALVLLLFQRGPRLGLAGLRARQDHAEPHARALAAAPTAAPAASKLAIRSCSAQRILQRASGGLRGAACLDGHAPLLRLGRGQRRAGLRHGLLARLLDGLSARAHAI